MSRKVDAEALALTDDAIKAEIIPADKQLPLMSLARHHGIDALRDAIRCIALVKLTDEQLLILKTCNVTVIDYIRNKARQKRGG